MTTINSNCSRCGMSHTTGMCATTANVTSWNGVTTFRCTCGDAYSLMMPRPACPLHPPTTACAPTPMFGQTFTATWPPAPSRMSDEDVERIARRVVDLMREAK